MKRISPRPSKKILHYCSMLFDGVTVKGALLTVIFGFLFSFLFFVYLFCFY